MNSNEVTVGLIGLDTSHVTAFAGLINLDDNPHHVRGARITLGYPGGSPDMPASIDRVDKFTADLRDKLGVKIVDSPQAVAEACDVVLITAVDGRAHRGPFEQIVSFGKPTFIDKPFAVTTDDAQAMLALAKKHNVPLMSCSSLRYAQPFVDALAEQEPGGVVAIDVTGPMALVPQLPGMFWYGVHTVEMVVAALGPGCLRVRAETREHQEVFTLEYDGGKLATIRGMRECTSSFEVMIHRENGVQHVSPYAGPPPYAGMLRAIMDHLPHGKSAVPEAEMLAAVRIMEAGNLSRDTGEWIELD